MQTPLDLTLLKSFQVLAEQLNFRLASERLYLDQSALSRRIKKLEEQLGYKLLERTTRDVSLTPAGRQLYQESLGIFEQYETSLARTKLVADGKAGQLRIGYMAFAATELMPRAVARFKRKYPDIEMNLRYIRSQGQKIALANGEIDVGYMIGPFEHPDFETVLLSSELLYVVTPKNHELLSKYQLKPAELADYPIVLGSMPEWDEYRWRLNELFSQNGIELNTALEASNTLALIGLVAAGLGVTIYPESLIGYLGRNVEVRPIFDPTFRSRTVLAWRKNSKTEALRKFLDIATNLSP